MQPQIIKKRNKRFEWKAAQTTDALSSPLTQMALMSDSWPVKVCRHILSLMSHSLTEASQAPDTKVRRSGDRERLMTSPLWPEKTVVCWLVSMSHSALGQRAQTLDTYRLRKSMFALRVCLQHSPCGVSWTRDDLIVINETATWEITWENRKCTHLDEFLSELKETCIVFDRSESQMRIFKSIYLLQK